MRKERETGMRMYRIRRGRTEPVAQCRVPSLGKTGRDDKTFIRVLDFDDVEHSMRMNPVQHRYLPTLQECSAFAERVIAEAYNDYDCRGNRICIREAFWMESCVNMLAAAVHFFVNYRRMPYDGDGRELVPEYTEDPETHHVRLTGRAFSAEGIPATPAYWLGRYSDMPHVLSFLQCDYRTVFEILATDPETYTLMLPFMTAYRNKAMEQLEGMFGTLRTMLARLATKEAYWILSKDGDDFRVREDETNYITVIARKSAPKVAAMLNAVVTGSRPSPYPISEGWSITMERIMEYKPYSFPAGNGKDEILYGNFRQVNEDIRKMETEIQKEYEKK